MFMYSLFGCSDVAVIISVYHMHCFSAALLLSRSLHECVRYQNRVVNQYRMDMDGGNRLSGCTGIITIECNHWQMERNERNMR